MTAAPAIDWAALVPFPAGQAIALEIRKFVFTIRGDGAITALDKGTVGIRMHVPAQLGIDDTVLDLTLSYRGREDGNGLALDRTRRGATKRTAHDDMRMIVQPSGKVRVERDGDEPMAFTIGRTPAGLVIGELSGFGQLDGATLTLRAG